MRIGRGLAGGTAGAANAQDARARARRRALLPMLLALACLVADPGRAQDTYLPMPGATAPAPAAPNIVQTRTSDTPAAGPAEQVTPEKFVGDNMAPNPLSSAGTSAVDASPGELSQAELSPAELSPAERAQQAAAADPFPEWTRLAERAEASLDAGLASTAAFEHLRADIATWRSRFQGEQVVNAGRIAAVRAQITALGPEPDAGQPEAATLTTRRDELRRQLADLEAPRRVADEAYSRADGLIREIDSLIRERQTGELLTLGPSPLNPAWWRPAYAALRGTLRLIGVETAEAAAERSRMAGATRSNAIAAGLLLLSLVLILRSRVWLRAVGARLARSRSGQAASVIDFFGSLVRMTLLFGGFLALQVALETSGLVGFRARVIVGEIARLGVFVAVSHWLAGRLFGQGGRGGEPPLLAADRPRSGRIAVDLLGVTMWLIILVRRVGEFEDWPDTSRAVLLFPVLLVAGLCLVHIGRLIGRAPAGPVPAAAPAAGDAPVRDGRGVLARNVGKAVMLLGVMGPVLAGVGYQSAARFLTFPTALTLALGAALILLHGALARLYGIATGRPEAQVREALAPVLIGMVLVAASVPVLALIWGARVADLTEIWARVRDGFSVGDVRVSPGQFLTFLLVFAAGYAITRLVQGTLRTAVLPKTRIDTGGQNALVSGLGYLGMFVALLVAVTSTGVSLSSLAFVAGALSLGIGFGLQNIVQNFVAGVIMLIERPVAEGDWIEVGGNQGIVRAISVRSTRIETFDRNSVIVPNANFISEVVTNWTRGSLAGRITVSIRVAHGSDTRRIEALLREIVEAHPLVTLNPAPGVSFESIDADSYEFVIRAILRDINFGLSTRSELRHEIVRRFAEEGIEIPMARQRVWLHDAAAASGDGAALRTP